MGNYIKTGVLLGLLTAIFLTVGAMIGGETGMIIALGLAVATNLFAYWNSDKMVLRMYNAVEAAENSRLSLIVKALAVRADIPMPKVYYIDTPQPNAFATGRNPENASVAATAGLLNMLSDEEIAAVMAHELGHVRNRDTLIMTITASIAGAITMLAHSFGFLNLGRRDENGNGSGAGALIAVILAPIAAMVVNMAISRSREYEADRAGAEISGNPIALASALEKIERGASHIMNHEAANNPQTAHLFIINPIQALGGLRNLFSTHPATRNRVEALYEIASRMKMELPNANENYPADNTGQPLKRSPWE